jgi:hypothetical protein
VVAIDAIDLDSIPNLRNKQVVGVDYDLHNPRIARLRGGTRNFPEQAKFQILTQFGAIAALFIGIPIAWQILRSSSRRKMNATVAVRRSVDLQNQLEGYRLDIEPTLSERMASCAGLFISFASGPAHLSIRSTQAPPAAAAPSPVSIAPHHDHVPRPASMQRKSAAMFDQLCC